VKFFRSWHAVLSAALIAIGGSATPALAVTNTGIAAATSYVAAFAPIFGPSRVPYAGTMRLAIDDGRITGTYVGMSVRPDRLNDHVSPVTGTVNASDGHVQFYVGNALSVMGTLAADGGISGTATYDGRLYDFAAEPGSPAKR
jgi:hypothetical protein